MACVYGARLKFYMKSLVNTPFTHKHILLFFVLIISIFFSATELMANKNKLNHFGSLDRKLRILMAGGNEDLRNTLRNMDVGNIFDHDYKPNSLNETDFVLIFLKKWDDAHLLGEGFDFIRPSIQEMPTDSLNLFRVYKVRDGVEIRSLAILVYATDNLKELSFECYAKDIIKKLTKRSNESYFNIKKCN